jgi:hypothetical protein
MSLDKAIEKGEEKRKPRVVRMVVVHIADRIENISIKRNKMLAKIR